MAQYIDKTNLVAEIEKRISENKKEIERAQHKNLEDYFEGYEDALVLFKEKFLDTLEVKEVDLEKELKEDWLFADKSEVDCLESMCLTEDMFVSLAKKYFQLGLEAAQKGK